MDAVSYPSIEVASSYRHAQSAGQELCTIIAYSFSLRPPTGA